MKSISYWIRGYFGFTQKEASGFIILVSLMIIILFAPLIYDNIIPDPKNTFLKDQSILDSLVAEMDQKRSYKAISKEKNQTTEKNHFFNFDPNNAVLADLKKLGLQTYLAERIVKFRTKGGKFRVKNDLQKIYGFSPEQFQEIKPFILLPDSLQPVAKDLPNKKKILLSFDINKADTAALNRLKGIGNVMSARIIKYREKLGGFVNGSQYAEVYSISPEALEDLKTKTFIGSEPPILINVNTAAWELFSAHPYIGKKIAFSLINFRTQHGKFNDFEALKQIIGITPAQLEKLKPYLSF